MSARVHAPRGTRDVLPAESGVRALIEAAARESFARHAYGRVTTPTFEDIELFVRGVGTSTDIVRKEMYVLEDQGGRRLALRPEGTAGVARAYVEHGMHKLPQPVKLWYLAPMFRQEAPQSGRYREHWQVGAEAIGSEDPLLDAEVVSLLAGLYETLGVPGVRLRLGTLGDAASRAAHREELGAFLVRHAGDLPEDARARADENPLRLFDHKDTAVAAVMAEAPRLVAFLTPEAALHIDTVERVLDAMGIAYVRDDTLVRGLDYYTHTVFEFTCDALGAQSGIGGGGRYDGLVEQIGGPPAPGVGFGTGVERITLALGSTPPEPPGLDCYVAIPDPELRITLAPLVATLRAAGLRCETDLRGRSMKAMMRHANGLGARQVVIIGPREIDEGVATVRDMSDGSERRVGIAALAEALA